jgi:hypothetical protein
VDREHFGAEDAFCWAFLITPVFTHRYTWHGVLAPSGVDLLCETPSDSGSLRRANAPSAVAPAEMPLQTSSRHTHPCNHENFNKTSNCDQMVLSVKQKIKLGSERVTLREELNPDTWWFDWVATLAHESTRQTKEGHKTRFVCIACVH